MYGKTKMNCSKLIRANNKLINKLINKLMQSKTGLDCVSTFGKKMVHDHGMYHSFLRFIRPHRRSPAGLERERQSCIPRRARTSTGQTHGSNEVTAERESGVSCIAALSGRPEDGKRKTRQRLEHRPHGRGAG